MNENMVKVLNREGKVNEGKVLLFLKDKETEKMYLCYTFDEKNDENIIVLASVLKSNSDSYYMDILEDSEWRKLIDYMKLTFNKDDELTNKVYLLGINDELSKDTIIVDRGHKTAAMREEIVLGLRDSYIEAISKKSEIKDLTDNFGFNPLRNFKDDYKLPEEYSLPKETKYDDYKVSNEYNYSKEDYNLPKDDYKLKEDYNLPKETKYDDYKLPEIKATAETYELPKYSTGYSFERKEEVKPDKSYRESFEEKYPQVEARKVREEEYRRYEETPRSRYDKKDNDDVAYEKILETLEANNELLKAIREALAREKNGNR